MLWLRSFALQSARIKSTVSKARLFLNFSAYFGHPSPVELLSRHFYFFCKALVKFYMAPSLTCKHQRVFLFSATCRFLLLTCPCASFHTVAVEKQCISQLISKTVFCLFYA